MTDAATEDARPPVRRLAGRALQGVERVAAKWVCPIDRPPIEDGVVEIADGRIVAVRSQAEAPDAATLDLGNAALLPALANAHAHLEFSDLAAPIQPPAPFTDWIRNLLSYRRQRTGSTAELVAAGLREAADAGTGVVGEIATGDWSAAAVASAISNEFPDGDAPTIVAFRELIGLRPEQAAAQLELARQHIDDCRRVSRETGVDLRPALSPHAPYSVGPELYRQLVDLARRESVPLCMHLAETRAELELLDRGTGEFVDLLRGFGLWEPGLLPRGLRPLDYLEPLATLEHALIAHGNYLSDDEIAWLGRHPHVAVVYCPRTHAFFGHSEHPWPKLLAAGATVCLGTDGRSSNPDYSLWSELQCLAEASDKTGMSDLLRLVTFAGTAALGVESDLGGLSPGKIAAFSVFELTTPGAPIILRGFVG